MVRYSNGAQIGSRVACLSIHSRHMYWGINASAVMFLWERRTALGMPVVPEEYNKQMALSSSSWGSVIRVQSNSCCDMQLMPSRALVKLRECESRTRTWFSGTPHSLAAPIATSLVSSLQAIRLAPPCLTCRDNSGTVALVLAAE